MKKTPDNLKQWNNDKVRPPFQALSMLKTEEKCITLIQIKCFFCFYYHIGSIICNTSQLTVDLIGMLWLSPPFHCTERDAYGICTLYQEGTPKRSVVILPSFYIIPVPLSAIVCYLKFSNVFFLLAIRFHWLQPKILTHRVFKSYFVCNGKKNCQEKIFSFNNCPK